MATDWNKSLRTNITQAYAETTLKRNISAKKLVKITKAKLLKLKLKLK